MVKKSRLGLYLEDEEIKTQVKIAAARCVFRSKKATLSEQTGRPFGVK
jgi:hypothetical protein